MHIRKTQPLLKPLMSSQNPFFPLDVFQVGPKSISRGTMGFQEEQWGFKRKKGVSRGHKRFQERLCFPDAFPYLPSIGRLLSSLYFSNSLNTQSSKTFLARTQPCPCPKTPLPILDLKKIQDTLSQLSKAVDTLKSLPPSKSKQKASTQNTYTPGPIHNPTPCTFAAVAGARPPNPSLMVDLAPLGISQKDWVKPVHLCHALNQGLSTISPPQV